MTAALVRQTAARLDSVVEEVGGPYKRTVRSWLAYHPTQGILPRRASTAPCGASAAPWPSGAQRERTTVDTAMPQRRRPSRALACSRGRPRSPRSRPFRPLAARRSPPRDRARAPLRRRRDGSSNPRRRRARVRDVRLLVRVQSVRRAAGAAGDARRVPRRAPCGHDAPTRRAPARSALCTAVLSISPARSPREWVEVRRRAICPSSSTASSSSFRAIAERTIQAKCRGGVYRGAARRCKGAKAPRRNDTAGLGMGSVSA